MLRTGPISDLVTNVKQSTARTGLFGLQPHDPVTMLLAMALLGTVALAAAYAPARRADALEPMAALREE